MLTFGLQTHVTLTNALFIASRSFVSKMKVDFNTIVSVHLLVVCTTVSTADYTDGAAVRYNNAPTYSLR